MATKTKTRKFEDTDVVIAGNGFWHGGRPIPVGSELMASDEAVQAHPEWFYRVGAPPEERFTPEGLSTKAAMERTAKEQADRPAPPPKPYNASTPIGEFVTSRTEIIASRVGRMRSGSILHVSDPRIAELDQADWVPLIDSIR